MKTAFTEIRNSKDRLERAKSMRNWKVELSMSHRETETKNAKRRRNTEHRMKRYLKDF